jgi:exodeoxyribonuclease VII large subunit
MTDSTAPPPQPQREVFSVSRLNAEVRAVLEAAIPLLWVEGELSNVARPGSGHLYFTLKDAHAQVRCAMFRTRAAHLRFRPEDGRHVLARVRVGLYEPRGEFQLVVEHMEEAGDGALRRAFDALKQRLAAEGLFDAALKRPLPALPRCVGVVTSATGAAIRDILSVLQRRCPALPVVLYPVPVQGAGAALQIAAAIRTAGERGDCDVLIVGRGGGSLEDLWAFNEEVVARAVRACPIPVVSAVGHEIDFTISDFAADRRAATPSAAAELVSPDQAEWRQRLELLGRRLTRAMGNGIARRRQQAAACGRRLRHPGRRLQVHAQRLDELEQRLGRAQRHLLRHLTARLAQAHAHLSRLTPVNRLLRLEAQRCELERRLHGAMQQRLERHSARLTGAARALDAVSPLATLARGYAIVTRVADSAVVHRYDEVDLGDRVTARLGRGRLVCRVEERNDEEN